MTGQFWLPCIRFGFTGQERIQSSRKKVFFIAALVLGIMVTAELPGAAGIAAGAGAMIAVLAAGVCVLVFYNGKKSQKHFLVKKYFFYVFYPAHLVILALLKI